MDNLDIEIYLNEIKAALINTQSASEIKKTLFQMESTFNHHFSDLDSEDHYLNLYKFQIKLVIDLLSEPQFFLKKHGAQHILPSVILIISPSEKSALLQTFIKYYPLYESEALCSAVCNFIYYEINHHDPQTTLTIYRQLLETKPTKNGLRALNLASYVNCRVNIGKG